jgi:RNA polymerase sigma-70 factor (ECF subfamily)
VVSSEPSDAELLARHVDGDPDAFGEIVRRHRDRLWAVALRTTGDPEEAADALQDALVSAFRAAGGFRGDAAVTTWLHRVVVNACLDRARRRAARPAVSLPEDDSVGSPSAGDAIGAREDHLEVTRALAGLPFEQRAVLVLVDMHGYSVEETARMLDIAPGTVKSRCARARAKLVPVLAHLRPGYAGNPPRSSRVQLPEPETGTDRPRGR